MVMRITGMSSGMDIQSMVTSLMQVERLPIQKLEQKKKLLSYQTDLYREINTKVAALRSKVEASRLSSTMTGMKASSSSTDVTVTANTVTSAVTKTLNVTQLASAAEVKGNSGVTSMGITGSAITAPVDITAGVNDKIIVQFDGSTKSITVPAGNYATATDFAAAMQTAVNTAFGTNNMTVTANASNELSIAPVDKNGYKAQIVVKESTLPLADIGLTDGQSYRLDLNAKISDMAGKFATPLDGSGTYQFTVNGKTITVDGNKSLNDVIQAVNTSGAGVTMSYDSMADQFVFKNRSTGAASEVTLASTTGNFLSAIGVADQTVNGKNAQFTLDGVPNSQASNNFTLDGIGYRLNQANGVDITVTLANDPDAIVNKLKEFVTAYNEVIELVNKRLSENRSRGYDPLTDEQKKDMKETDIALWEAEVKKGLLGDSDILKELKTSTRELFSRKMDGVGEYNILASIGVTTLPQVQGNIIDSGKLQIDETRLREAIATDPEGVNKLLTNNPGIESQEGLMVTMYNRVNDIVGKLNDKAGRTTSATTDITSEIGKKMNAITLKMSDLEAKMVKKENYYYQRFSAMEAAMSKSNSTIAWLSQQFG
ncbi:flagellar filament capping protein FliD [Paenibacillus harenae]|uniref:flagellar filament capping protein FliD n=1 Tax=Paenibacillus harenae TaxID=306543 RepID=UPI00279419A4|nr:flagellar filament capping protein FliD [Paenibacillus harenae]MDQ0062042.1 flagellar hook-associated protein 2 [Paenibacillus harenae]